MNMVIWTTAKCNLNCTYCYESHNNQKNNTVNEEDIIRFLNNGHLKNTERPKLIAFHGGEPLLNYDLIGSVADFCDKSGWDTRFTFTTNGTVWNQTIEKIVTDHYQAFEHGISVSIDGNQKTHDTYRKDLYGKGTYDAVIKTGKKILSIFPNTYARMTVRTNTIDALPDNIAYLIGIGFRKISAMIDYYDDWKEEDVKHIYHAYERIIQEWAAKRDLEISVVEQLRSRKPAGICMLSYNIYTDGNIYPCTYVTGKLNYVVGNIVNGYDYDKIIQWNRINEKNYDFCTECLNLKYCIHNRCKFVNMMITHSLVTPCGIGCRLESIKNELSIKYDAVLLQE